MDLANSPYFAMLKTRLSALSHRQSLVAQNIANASTPGYRPRDLDMKTFDAAMQGAAAALSPTGGPRVARTHPAHMPLAQGSGGRVNAQMLADSETTLDGNAVVLEDQMMRAAETRIAYETGLSLYQKGLQFIRMAARAPGR